MATRARRAASADRVEPHEPIFGRLIEELRGLRVERHENFKPPSFDGEGDVDMFIQHFQEVADANRWTEIATLLHLRKKSTRCSPRLQPVSYHRRDLHGFEKSIRADTQRG